MTESIANINSGTAYSTGDVLLATATNGIVANARLAHAVSLGGFSPIVLSTTAGGATLPLPVWNTQTLNMLCMLSSGAYYGIEALPGGGTLYHAATGLPASTGLVLGYNSGAAKFDAMKSGTAASSLYVSSDATLDSFSTVALGSPTIDAQGYYGRTATSRWFCGVSGSDGLIIEIGTTSIVSSATNTGRPLMVITGNGSTGLVAVGDAAVSYSTNSGTSWTHGALTMPTGYAGNPLAIAWDASRSVYVVSTILPTGELTWTTSATGASWQAWRKSAQLVIDTTWYGAFGGSESAGIAVIGSTWVAPYAHGQLGSYGDVKLGLLVSIDGGASWRAVVGSEGGVSNYYGINCIAAGNRVALVGQFGFLPGPDVVASDLANSVAV